MFVSLVLMKLCYILSGFLVFFREFIGVFNCEGIWGLIFIYYFFKIIMLVGLLINGYCVVGNGLLVVLLKCGIVIDCVDCNVLMVLRVSEILCVSGMLCVVNNGWMCEDSLLWCVLLK